MIKKFKFSHVALENVIFDHITIDVIGFHAWVRMMDYIL
jgi:hypothetical protein